MSESTGSLGQGFTDAACLPPNLAQRAAPITERVREEGFEAPITSLSPHELAMEPDAHLLFRHASGYAALLVSLHWGEPPCFYYLSLLQRGRREELLVTASKRLSRRSTPANVRHTSREGSWSHWSYSGPWLWPWSWPHRDPLALWELHKRASALNRKGTLQPLPLGSDLITLVDGFRLALHRRLIATRQLRPLSRSDTLAAREKMKTARNFAERMVATGERHAWLFIRLHEEIARNAHRSAWRWSGLATALIVAGVAVILGAPSVLFLWALGVGALHLSARLVIHLLTRPIAKPLCRRRRLSVNGEATLMALAAITGPLVLGIGAALLAAFSTSPPPEALLCTATAALLLLPLPGTDGGELAERLLYSRAAWVKPLLYITIGGALAAWAWQKDALLLTWIGGLIALAPLLDPRRPLLARRLRREIDWSQGATPEAVSALITVLEKRRCSRRPRRHWRNWRPHSVSADQLASLYHDIHRRPPRLCATLGCLLLYAAALCLPLFPALRWLEHSPALTQLASANVNPPPPEARAKIKIKAKAEPLSLPLSLPTRLPSRVEWEAARNTEPPPFGEAASY